MSWRLESTLECFMTCVLTWEVASSHWVSIFGSLCAQSLPFHSATSLAPCLASHCTVCCRDVVSSTALVLPCNVALRHAEWLCACIGPFVGRKDFCNLPHNPGTGCCHYVSFKMLYPEAPSLPIFLCAMHYAIVIGDGTLVSKTMHLSAVALPMKPRGSFLGWNKV